MEYGRGGIAETFQKGMLSVFEGPNTKTQKRPNTEPQGVPEAPRSILWKGHSIFYNFGASTLAVTYQRGVFLMFEGHRTKAEKWPNTEPQGSP